MRLSSTSVARYCQIGVDQRGEVLPDRRREFRLRFEGFQHRRVGLDARERPFEGGGRDAVRRGLVPQAVDAMGEAVALRERGRASREACDEKEKRGNHRMNGARLQLD
jgi:hypothetical protein